MVGVVEAGIDGVGIEAEEPGPEPVVVAVLEDSQIRR